jgi:hypothetical protein
MDILLLNPKILAQTDIVAGLAQLLPSDALMVTVGEQKADETDALTGILPVAVDHSEVAIRNFKRRCM